MKQIPIDQPGKHPSGIARIKQKIKDYQSKSKQYNSLCYDPEEQITSQAYFDKIRRQSKKDAKNGGSLKKLVRSQSKSNDVSSKSNPLVKKNIGALYGQLMAVKSQYKKLKGSYQKLSQQKLQLTNRGLSDPQGCQQPLQQLQRQLAKYHKCNQTLENQMERIRKQSMRIVETEKFKNKKLQQIIQEKELMISYLRNEIQKMKKHSQSSYSTANQSAIMLYQNISQLGKQSSFNSISNSNIVVDAVHRSKIEEDSLCFSRDMESFNSLLTCYDPKKESVVIEPRKDDPYTQPSQCLTFEQRYQEPSQAKQTFKMPPKHNKKMMSKSKTTSKHHKRPNILTLGDENTDNNSKCDSSDFKPLSSNGSKFKKKATSSRKRI